LFQNLTQLRTLELNDCGLSHPPEEDVFSTSIYEDFQELHLAKNPLVMTESEPLLPRQLTNVQVLDMSNCNLRTLPRDAFVETPKITTLKLSGNSFGPDSLDLEFIKQLTHLETLDLSNCNLNHLSPNVFANSPNITSLKLTGNPWICSCSIYDLWEWAAVTKGNLTILVGSTTSREDVGTGSGRRKKGLVCHYESNRVQSPKTPSRTRTRGLHANRTWAKFVKESDCVSNRDPKAERYVDDGIIGRSISFYLEDPPPTWLVVGACVSVLIFLAMAVGTGMAFFLRKGKKKNFAKYPALAIDLEDMQSVAEVAPKRRRNQKNV
jgi:hypothetical protein